MTPHEAAEEKVTLAVEYARMSEQLEAILLIKADGWTALREEHNSDAQADRAWDATEYGKQELKLKMAMKRNEKRTSAINTLLRVKENEARGW